MSAAATADNASTASNEAVRTSGFKEGAELQRQILPRVGPGRQPRLCGFALAATWCVRPRRFTLPPVQEWSLPLVLAAASFLVVLLWRVRPLIPGRRRGTSREELRQAHARIDAATSEPERARALCDAADLMKTASAKALYLRALRADPGSVDVIQRVAAGLARRPRALESLLWRHLSAAPWRDFPDATSASLDALRTLYEGPLRNPTRAKAMSHARESLSSPAQTQ
jgi:hypothetical protein